MAIGQVISAFISSFVNAWPNKKLMKYNYFEQLRDLMPSFLCSIVMAIGVWSLNLIPVSALILLPIQIVFGAGVYILLCKIFRIDTFSYFINTIRGFKHGRK